MNHALHHLIGADDQAIVSVRQSAHRLGGYDQRALGGYGQSHLDGRGCAAQAEVIKIQVDIRWQVARILKIEGSVVAVKVSEKEGVIKFISSGLGQGRRGWAAIQQ